MGYINEIKFIEKGLSVSQVFKIENAPLLREFHAMTKRHPNGKIKGLFCVVPAECLERMIVYGMHPQDCDDSSVHEGEEEGVSTSASRSRGQRKSPLFCPSWSSYAIDGHKIQPNISEPHMAQKRVMSSHDLPVRYFDLILVIQSSVLILFAVPILPSFRDNFHAIVPWKK